MVAPPTSTTSTAPASAPSCDERTATSRATPVSTASGVTARTSRRNRGPRDRPLPPITCRRNAARIAALAGPGASSPTSGRTLAVGITVRPVSASRASAWSRTAVLPASTIGQRSRLRASRPALCSSTRVSPPSVPPASSTRSGRDARSAVRPAPVSSPADTCTTLAPAESATRYPASALTSRSWPTTASRSPPPADEQASTGTSVAANCSVTAPMPCSTSGGVVGCCAVPTSRPSAATNAALVQVDPTSRHSSAPASSRTTIVTRPPLPSCPPSPRPRLAPARRGRAGTGSRRARQSVSEIFCRPKWFRQPGFQFSTRVMLQTFSWQDP